MNRFLSLFFIATISICFLSCKSEKKTDDIIVDKVIDKPQDTPVRMGQDNRSGSATWVGGAEYSFNITRSSSDSLAIIENNGVKYHDNAITLVVSRANGTVFFKKTFTKANFSPVMPKSFKDTGVLLGMNLLKAEGDYMYFVVTIGSPDENNDEFFHALMTLDRFGSTKAETYKPEIKE